MKIRTGRSVLALSAAVALLASGCASEDGGDAGTADTSSEDTGADDSASEPAEEESTSEEAAPEVEGELLIWADERKIEPLQAIAPAFTEATGIDVTVELVPFGEIRDQVTQAGPAGEGPDVFAGAHDWTGELAANGIIAPVDLSAKLDQYNDVAVSGFTFEGDTYAVPYVTEALVLYWNKELVGDTAPATFEELAAACDEAGTDDCLTVPGGGEATDAYHNYPLISGAGGTIFAFDPDAGYDGATVTLDDEAALEGGAFLASQVEAGVVANTDYDTAKNLFLEGSAPFWMTGPWELGGLRESGLDYGVALIPSVDGSQPAMPFVGAQGFFVSQFSENALLAQTFLLDFISTDETMQALYDADPRGTAWNAVEDGLSDDPDVQVVAESVANGIPMPNVPEMASVWGPLGDNLLQVRNGALGGEDALTQSAEAVRAAIGG